MLGKLALHSMVAKLRVAAVHWNHRSEPLRFSPLFFRRAVSHECTILSLSCFNLEKHREFCK